MKIILLENGNNDRLAVLFKKGILIPRGAEIKCLGGTGSGILHIIEGGIEKKYCFKCGQFISARHFPSDKKNADGKYVYCGFCAAKAHKERRKKKKTNESHAPDTGRHYNYAIPPGAEIKYLGGARSGILHIIEGGIEKKYCPECGQFLPLCDFSRDKSRYSGLKTTCKKCVTEMKSLPSIITVKNSADIDKVLLYKNKGIIIPFGAKILEAPKGNNNPLFIPVFHGGIMKRYCPDCKRWLPVSGFDGHYPMSSLCSECFKKWRERKALYNRRHSKKRRIRRKLEGGKA
jgi:hypothetical protein